MPTAPRSTPADISTGKSLLRSPRGLLHSTLISPFAQRHIGPSEAEQLRMLNALGYSDLQEFIADVVPADILDPSPPVEALREGCGEAEALQQLKQLSAVSYTHLTLPTILLV